MNKTLSISYLILLALEVASEVLELRELTYVLKPLLMLFLTWVYLKSVGKPSYLIVAALLFSCLGDTFNLSDTYFIYALASFLVAHIFYIIYFAKEFKLNWVYIAAFIVFGLAMGYVVLSHVSSELKIPVMLYIVTICIMGITASSRNIGSTFLIFSIVGAILFIISDSVIALHKFVLDVPQRSLIVLSTYGLAQYYIIKSVLGFAQKK